MRSHRWVHHSLLVVFGIALGLAASEVASRVAYRAPWYMQLLDEQRRGEQLGYQLNELGLRDRDYPVSEPPSTRRVLIIGDSFTFGTGVRNDSAVFPALLEQMLNEPAGPERPARIDVLNGGLPGSHTGDWVQLLNRVNESFKPDVILVVFFLRDGTRTTAIRSFFKPIRDEIAARNRSSRLYRYSYIYRLVRDYRDRRQVAEQYTAQLQRAYFGTPEETVEWRLARDNILQLAQFAREHSAVLGLAIFPILVELDDHYPFRAICDAISTFAVGNAIPTHDLLLDFKGYDAPGLWVSPFNQHPNERGHAIAARALLPFVRQLLDTDIGSSAKAAWRDR